MPHRPRHVLSAVALAAAAGWAGCASDGEDGGKGLKEAIVEKDVKVASWIDRLAERLDLWLANDRYVDQPNRSRIVLRNAVSLAENGQRTYAPRVAAKLHLPNLQEKLQLTFTNYESDVEERGINESRYRPVKDKEATYGTSLALFQELGRVKTEFRPMVEYRDEVLTSYLFRFTSGFDSGPYSLDPELQLFARSDTGTGEFFGVDAGWQVREGDRLVLLNEEQYTDGDNTLSTNHGVKWSHAFTERMELTSKLVFEADNRPTYHHERFVASWAFWHRIWRNVLHYGVTPYLTFNKSRLYYPEAGLDLELDFVF